MKYFFIVFFNILLLVNLKAGTGVDLLSGGTGVRAFALGGAYTALADSAAGAAYNPAGLGQIKHSEIMSSSFSMFDGDLSKLSFDFVFPIDFGVIGLNFLQEAINDIPLVKDNNNQPEIYGSFDNTSRCFNLSFAKAIYWDITYFGINLKYFTESLSGATATGWGVDLGFIQYLPNNIKISLVARNILPVNLSWNTGHTDTIPLNIVTGVSYWQLLFGRVLLVSLDMDLVRSQKPTYVKYGLEYYVWGFPKKGSYKDIKSQIKRNPGLILRMGKNEFEELTFGIGFVYQEFKLDYAFQDHDLGNSSQIAIGYSF